MVYVFIYVFINVLGFILLREFMDIYLLFGMFWSCNLSLLSCVEKFGKFLLLVK